jgi:hypothetical protein
MNKATQMKTVAIWALCGVSALACAQASQKTFTSSDGVFRFRYPEMLMDCMVKRSATSDSCLSQGALCNGPGSEGTTKACFAYPRERLKEKPMFVAAAFFVSDIESAKTQSQCLKPSPDWLLISSKGITRINHVSFASFEIGDNWAGGGQSGPVYRTFHRGECFELGIQTVISRAAYDPDGHNNLTDQDLSEVDGPLKEALHSFVFLN